MLDFMLEMGINNLKELDPIVIDSHSTLDGWWDNNQFILIMIWLVPGLGINV